MSVRGVKKVNENIIQEGRSLVINEKDDSLLNMARIPDGSIKMDPQTGELYGKFGDVEHWVPLILKPDGTVAPPTHVQRYEECVEILDTDLDMKVFHYNYMGKTYVGEITEQGYEFELKKGNYRPGRARIYAVVNDEGYLTDKNGGIHEVDPEFVVLSFNKETADGSWPDLTHVCFYYFHSTKGGTGKKDVGAVWIDIYDLYQLTGEKYPMEQLEEIMNQPIFKIAHTEQDAEADGMKLLIEIETKDNTPEGFSEASRYTVGDNGVYNTTDKRIVVELDEDDLKRLGDNKVHETPNLYVDYSMPLPAKDLLTNDDYNAYYRAQATIEPGESMNIDVKSLFNEDKNGLDVLVQVEVRDFEEGFTKDKFISGEGVSIVSKTEQFIEVHNTYTEPLEFNILLR